MNSNNAALLSEIESDLSRIDELMAKANKISESIQAQLDAIYAEIKSYDNLLEVLRAAPTYR